MSNKIVINPHFKNWFKFNVFNMKNSPLESQIDVSSTNKRDGNCAGNSFGGGGGGGTIRLKASKVLHLYGSVNQKQLTVLALVSIGE